jgi:hypothetical protein
MFDSFRVYRLGEQPDRHSAKEIAIVRLSCEAGLRDCTAETRRTRSKEFLINKFSDLCELCASAVNISSQKIRNN